MRSHQPTDRRLSNKKGALTREQWTELMILFGVVLSTAAHFQSLPHWFQLLVRWRREAVIVLTKFRSSKAHHPNQILKEKQLSRSPLISAQEKTQSDVRGQENPSQTSGDRLHFPCVPPEIQKSRNQERQRGMIAGCQEEGSRKHRLHQDATSRKIPMPQSIGRPMAVYVERR